MGAFVSTEHGYPSLLVDGFASYFVLGRYRSVYDRGCQGLFGEIGPEYPSAMCNSVSLQMSNTLLRNPHYPMRMAVYRIEIHAGHYGPSAILTFPVTLAWKCLVGH